MAGLIRDRYEPLEVVGRGGQGEVVKALDRMHGRVVALKLRAAPSEHERDAILAEARILLSLRPHSLLPLVREDFFEGDRYVLVMDWVEGETLRALLDARGAPGLPLEEALGYLSDVAQALDHLHRHDPPIVHKDVKPANVIVSTDGKAILVDFGIAAGPGVSGGAGGTRGYVAPELAAGAVAGPAADVYGLAATAFSLLTGSPPRAGAHPRWKGIPKDRARLLDAALRRGLSLDPTRRPATASDLVAGMRSEPAIPNNLPLQLTSFVGRDRELEEVTRLLGTVRLLTLTGAAGIGKTRLALAAVAEALPGFEDGVWLVELAALADPGLLTAAIASALRLRERPGASLVDTVIEHFMTRQALLVLDNCEHLVDACAEAVRLLLRTCTRLRILTTSREPLGVEGETTWRVPPLAVPDPDAPPALLDASEAVRLFVDRARLVQPSFTLGEDVSGAVAQICRRLDGIPLAVELAAARTGVLSPSEIASRLDDRFRLLAASRRGAAGRLQSLRAAIDWSHDLLTADERSLLRRLSVFAGGWTLEAAEAVTAGDDLDLPAILDLLSQLVDKSLVTIDDAGVETRYGMLETIRRYASERLEASGEEEPVLVRHRDWYCALAERAERELEGADQARWMDLVEAEHDNLRTALELGLSGGDGTGPALRTAAALWRFWHVRGYLSEGRRWLERALGRNEDAPSPIRARALRGAGSLAWDQGDYAAARSLHERGLGLARASGDREMIASALNGLAIAAGSQSDFPSERALYEEALGIWRETGNMRGIAVTLGNLAASLNEQGEHATARALFEESLAIRRELGDKQGIAQALNGLARAAGALGDGEAERALSEESLAIWRELGHKRNIAVLLTNLGAAAEARGEFTQARSLLEESVATLRELGVRADLAEALHRLGELALATGDAAQAARLHREALEIRASLGDKRGIAECLEGLAGVAAARAGMPECARLLGAASSLREAIGAPLPARGRAASDRVAGAARSALGESAFAAAWAEGRAMSLGDSVAEAARVTA